MAVRIGLPRVRYSDENEYSDRPGYHDVQYEMILMSNKNLLADDSVREAVMRYSSDIYFMEAFAADYLHRLSACRRSPSASSESGGTRHLDPPNVSLDSMNSSSGTFYF